MRLLEIEAAGPRENEFVDSSNSYSASLTNSTAVSPVLRATGHSLHLWESSRLSWIVLGLITLLYVGTCFAPVIFDDNEGLYAGAVREMHQSGDWLVPTSNGFPRVQKPPLVYWTMLVATSLFGANEFALRLPNALATAAWIVATYLIMRRLGGERFGVAAAVVLASMLGVWVFNHLVQPEPFLACFISLAIWCLVEARSLVKPPLAFAPRRLLGERFSGDQWYLLFWIFLALGSLSKGLHGALWPLGTVLLTALFVPGWRPWLRPVASLRGVLVFLLLLAPWYAYMAVRFPGFLAAHFVNEQVGAALNTRYPADAKQLPLVQFYLQHFLFWMPWTMLLPGAIYAVVKAGQAAQSRPDFLSSPTADSIKLLAIWFGLTLVSVAFSTRQDYYSMSCWGVMAAFLALPWMAREISPVRMPRLFLAVPCACVTIGGALGLGFAIWITPRLGALGAATAAPIGQRDTFMDAIAGISPALWGHFILLLGIFGAAMLIAGAAGTVLSWRGRSFPALLVLAGAMAVPVCLATAGFTMMGPYFSLAGEARTINRAMVSEPDALVACEGAPHTASSLYYYLNAPVHWVNTPFDQDYPQRVLHLGRDDYWDEAAVKNAWASHRPVYLILEEDRLVYWQAALPDARIFNQGGTRVVLSNR
jgi:4-amino-4-deoxy-L-arabinose transferase-like glycosyltransferase